MAEALTIEAPDFAAIEKETGQLTAQGLQRMWFALTGGLQKARASSQVSKDRIEPRLIQTPVTSSQNNFDLGGSSVLQFTGASSISLTGVGAPETNKTRVLHILNTGSGTLTIPAASGSSSAANQFATAGSLAANEGGTWVYASANWRYLGTTNASMLTSGTLPDARLSSNVVLKNAQNVFAGSGGVAIQITRVGGAVSILGTTGLIIDSTGANDTYINQVATGAVRLAGGGGIVYASSAAAGAASRATLKSLADETTGWALHQTSTTYSTAPSNADDPMNIASATNLVSGRGGGLNLVAANGPIRFAAGNAAEDMRLHASGGLSVGNTTDPGATNLYVTGKIRSDAAGSAPGGGLGAAPLASYGTIGSYCGTPTVWLTVNVSGTDYVVPAY